MRATALDLVGDHSRPNYEYVRPDYENHWSDNWLAPVPGLWDDGNRQHSEPNLLDLALPFLQGGCDDLQPPSSVPTRNVGFGELDHNPAPEGEILQPDNHGGKCQSSQINCAHEPTNPGESIRNFREIEMDEEVGLQSLPQSVHGDEVSEPNNHKRKCRSYPSNYPSKTSKHVKLRVSFKVSEFFVEIPETVTVSFLKKTIMEKAIAIVGGGEHVDLLVRGKKIIDEIKILSETGISHESRLDVILEPKPLTRYSPAAAVVHQGTHDASTDPLFCNLDNKIREDHEVTESQTDILVGKNATSREVIVCPAMNVEALDTGPVHQTINSSKTAQRRKSEFFSVSEVETLVQEVEKLGTGRWQKIKEEAFGNVSNRTHMDLKDKWRSLVKTAHRPANKRRGAVIPQAILDRVLAIETHNSQQEAMQRFTEFSNSINGFEFDEDTISPTFDQSETFAKKFKFKDDPVDLNFLDCPSVPPDPNPVLISLRLSGSSELDSPDDGDLSDDVFKYINSMLMEENMEPKPSMFHDPLALKAIEKSLYDVIVEKYLDSPNQPFFT